VKAGGFKGYSWVVELLVARLLRCWVAVFSMKKFMTRKKNSSQAGQPEQPSNAATKQSSNLLLARRSLL
jgi:hypothetical protein